MTQDARRARPRLSFAGRPAPRLETERGIYEVLDLSPEGMRIRTPAGTQPAITLGAVLQATLRFPADRAIAVEGRVLRIADGEAAVRLERGQERLASTLPAGPATRRSGLLW
jgi:hypothetical protein